MKIINSLVTLFVVLSFCACRQKEEHVVLISIDGFRPELYMDKSFETPNLASGTGIKAGAIVPEMGIKDISPIISKLLGLAFKAPDGVLYSQLLKN